MPTLVPWELVSKLGDPPRERLPEPPSVRRIDSVEPAIWQRAHLWTRSIGDAAAQRHDVWEAARRPVSEAPLMGAGFVRVPPALYCPFPKADDFIFGFCVFADPKQAGEPAFLSPLNVADEYFPLLVVPAGYTPHMPPLGPPDPTDSTGIVRGTAACWARAKPGGPNPTGLSGDGILTAGHVAMSVSAVPGITPGAVHAVAGFAIDAAVLAPETAPSHALKLAIGPSVVGASVDVYTQSGGFTSATVLLDFQPTGYFGKNCPHRAIIDLGFAPGDSGSLVRDSQAGDGIGIYIGDVHPPGGPVQGACQLLQQVTAEFGIDLFL